MSPASETRFPEFAEAEREFLRDRPAYARTRAIDSLRETEYERLDRLGHVYLDYTGGSLYAASQLRAHADLLGGSVFGNPHSTNPTSIAMTERVERARARVLEHFRAAPDEYLAIFTLNASGALKHVGESYPFGPGSRYLLTFDNHNSVNGIREFAKRRGAAVVYTPVVRPALRIDRAELTRHLAGADRSRPNLFAYPAQSNFTGVQHPLDLVDEAHAAGWDVLLDAAAFVPTNPLDLSRVKPDLVSVSFYKMFGYPTGVGALLLRRPMFAKLARPWFAGGTVRIASVQGNGHYLATDAAAYEDGTVSYLNLPAVEIGLRHLASVGLDAIHERVRCLAGWTLEQMGAMRHRGGAPLVQIHGPTDLEARGGTIAFNLNDPEGRSYDIRRIEELANEERISLRTGCFCNPGAGEAAYALTPEQIGRFFHDETGLTFQELRERIREAYGKEIGAARISLGIASNFADVYRFARFLDGFRDRAAAEVGAATTPASGHGEFRDSA